MTKSHMTKSQLLSTAAVALLLTAGAASAQSNKVQHQTAPQAASQDQSKNGPAAQDKSAQHHQQMQQKSAQQERMQNRSTTTGQASPSERMREQPGQSKQSEQKSQKHEQNASRKAEQRQNAKKQPSSTEKRSTTGQASADKSGSESPSTTHNQQPNAKQSNGSAPSNAKQAAEPSNAHRAAQPSGNTTRSASGQPSGQRQAQGVNLDPQQRSRVTRAVFAQNNVPRADHVRFSVSVGTAVPRHVHLVAVPDTLIDIHPAWRGDEYVVVRDEIVIVDHRRRIVAVIPAGDRRASAGSSSSTTVVDLSPAEIREVQTVLIRKGVYHGDADGIWGPETRKALITFQRREGIETTGRIDTRTVSSLGLSGKIQVGRGHGQQGGGAATTGSGNPSMNGQNKAGQNNMPSTSAHKNAVPSKSPKETSGQGSPSDAKQGAMRSQPSDRGANANSMQPRASTQPSHKSTTGQGSSPSMNKSEHKTDRTK